MLMNYLSRQLRKSMLKGIMVEQHVNMKKLIVFGGIIIVLTPNKKSNSIFIQNYRLAQVGQGRN